MEIIDNLVKLTIIMGSTAIMIFVYYKMVKYTDKHSNSKDGKE